MDRTNAKRQRRYMAKLKTTAQTAITNEARMAELEKMNNELRSRLRRASHTIFMTKAERRNIRACLHPDGAASLIDKKRRTRAFQAFEALPICEIPDKS